MCYDVQVVYGSFPSFEKHVPLILKKLHDFYLNRVFFKCKTFFHWSTSFGWPIEYVRYMSFSCYHVADEVCVCVCFPSFFSRMLCHSSLNKQKMQGWDVASRVTHRGFGTSPVSKDIHRTVEIAEVLFLHPFCHFWDDFISIKRLSAPSEKLNFESCFCQKLRYFSINVDILWCFCHRVSLFSTYSGSRNDNFWSRWDKKLEVGLLKGLALLSRRTLTSFFFFFALIMKIACHVACQYLITNEKGMKCMTFLFMSGFVAEQKSPLAPNGGPAMGVGAGRGAPPSSPGTNIIVHHTNMCSISNPPTNQAMETVSNIWQVSCLNSSHCVHLLTSNGSQRWSRALQSAVVRVQYYSTLKSCLGTKL